MPVSYPDLVLGHFEGYVLRRVLVEQTNNKGIARLALFDWRIDRNDEKDLAMIFVRQEKEANDRSVGEFEVERASVQMQKGGIDLQVVTPTWSQALDIVERGDGGSLRL